MRKIEKSKNCYISTKIGDLVLRTLGVHGTSRKHETNQPHDGLDYNTPLAYSRKAKVAPGQTNCGLSRDGELDLILLRL